MIRFRDNIWYTKLGEQIALHVCTNICIQMDSIAYQPGISYCTSPQGFIEGESLEKMLREITRADTPPSEEATVHLSHSFPRADGACKLHEDANGFAFRRRRRIDEMYDYALHRAVLGALVTCKAVSASSKPYGPKPTYRSLL